jgi:glycerophosphoryl diester phosphodiesterase
VAHRGSWSQHRENTLDAFVAAYQEGADMVELDVWLSADGIAVVHHDEAVGGLPIGSLSQAQLTTLARCEAQRGGPGGGWLVRPRTRGGSPCR